MKTANQGGNDIPWDFVLKTGGSLLTAIDGQLSYCFDCLCLWRCCDACCHCNISGNYYSYWTVRLSVRPSVCHAPVLYRNALTYQRILFLAYGSPIILNTFAKFRQGHPYGSIEYRWIYINCRPMYGQYVGNDATQGRSYYGTVIGSHMCSIEPWHCDDLEWPLKVISSSLAKFLVGTRLNIHVFLL